MKFVIKGVLGYVQPSAKASMIILGSASREKFHNRVRRFTQAGKNSRERMRFRPRPESRESPMKTLQKERSLSYCTLISMWGVL